MSDDILSKQIAKHQSNFFGNDQVGATLSRVEFPKGCNERVSKWLKEFKHFLVLTGPVGTGKTYFCSALLEALMRQEKRHLSIRVYNERDLLKRLRMSMKDSSQGDYIDHLQFLIDDDFIIIDDLGSSGHTQWREEVLLEAIDYRYSRNLPTVFTSNLSPGQFREIYGERIYDRLFASKNSCINVDGMDSYRQRGY